MIAAERPELARQQLLGALAACGAAVVRFVASGGFGKSTLAWELARREGPVASCSLLGAGTQSEAWRRLITALAKLDAANGARIVRESTALAFAGDAERNAYVQTVSERAQLRGTLLVDDADEAGEAAAEPLRALFAGRPRCCVIVCSRLTLPIALATWYAPHEFVTVRESDLQFDRADVRRLLPQAPKDRVERVLRWSRGWPIAAIRAVAMIRAGENLPDSAADDAWMQQFIQQTLESASPPVRESLLRLAAIRAPVQRDELDVFMSAVPFVSERPDGAIELHALAREVLLRTHGGECERQLHVLSTQAAERGDWLRCAELALQQGNPERAADALERTAHNPLQLPSPRYLAVLERLGSAIVLGRPSLWWICATSFQSDFLSMAEELEPVLRDAWDGLPPPAQSACAALVCQRKAEYRGEWEDAWRLLDGYEMRIDASALSVQDRLPAALCRCSIAANSGWEFDDAAFEREFGEWLRRYPSLLPDYRYLQATRAFFHADAAAVAQAIERYVEAMRALDDAVQLRAGLYRALWLPWEIGAYELHERLRRELVEMLRQPATPNDLLSRISWEMIDAAQGVAPVREDPTVAIGCLTNLLIAACTDDYDEAVTAIAEAARMCANPAFRAMAVVARVAAFAFDPAYESLLESAFDNFRADACPKLRRAVAAVRDGDERTFLQPFVARFRAAGQRARTMLFVDTARSCARRNGETIRFAGREHELLMLLAAAGRPLQNFEIAEMLWPESDDDAARNSLKVCVSRIRARAGSKEVIVTAGGDLSISPEHVQTDLARAERLLRIAEEGSAMAARGARAILERQRERTAASSTWEQLLRARVDALGAHAVLRS